MWKLARHLDKYQYARTNPHLVRLIGVLGICTSLLMGYGLWKYIQLKPLYLLLFGPIAVIVIMNKVVRYTMQLFYQQFDIPKHEQFIEEFWEKHEEPSVNVFLPWAGEDLQMHEKVVKAVANLDYKNYKAYMLDDIGSAEHKAIAEKYGFVYLSRPNKGKYKKSGNLQYGYEHSDGEFVFILDADFIPVKDALRDIVPYIASNKKIGILQTPQYFEQTKDVHKKSKIEFGGGNIVEDFYRIIMPCRDEFKAAMCVGTSAIYRRSVMEKLGTPKVEASEDLATGLIITQFGYYVKYLPIIISIGKSPDTYQGYFKQHMRWCSGNLVFAKFWPKAQLSLMARLVYLVNPLYYLSEALSVLFAFQFLTLLYFHADSLSLLHTLYFVPYMIVSRIIVPSNKINKNKTGTRLAAMNNSYTYFYTYIRLIMNNIPTWHPTGAKFNGLHKDFRQAINIGILISSVYLLLFLAILLTKPFLFGNYNTYIILAWSFYAVFWHTRYISSVTQYMHPLRLAAATNTLEKMFVTTKTHLNYVLFFMLIGVALFNSAITLFDTTSPTARAIKNISSNQKRNVDQPAIQAVKEFSESNNLLITKEQMQYAAQILSKNNSSDETIGFEQKQIVNAIALTIEKH